MSLLERDRAALVVVDVQEGFRSYATFEAVASACAKLVRGARILEVPRIVSEQYPKGLGHTAPDASTGAGDDANLACQVEIAAHQLAPSRLIFCARLQRCTSDGPS